jgi:hypothetical protein
MKAKMIPVTLLAAVLIVSPFQAARGFPIGVSIHGGLGKGYYSMGELNDNINELRLLHGANLSDLSNGTNVMLQGRVWLFERIGFTATYEHFWGESQIGTLEGTINIKTPGDVYSVGGIARLFSLPRFVDLNVGISVSLVNSIYGTSQDFTRSLAEFKGSDNGYEIYAEAMTNFVRPLQFGLMLGYRGLKVTEFEDRHGDIAYFEPSNVAIEIDYSGVFFYLTAGIGL